MLSAEDLLVSFFYWALFTFCIFKFPFFKKFGIATKWIAGVLFLKIAFGFAYGIIHFKLYAGGDTFSYFSDSKIVLSALPDHPLKFLQLVFGFNHRPPDSPIAAYAYDMNFYTDRSAYFLVRIISLMNLLTYSHYYANVVIYNFCTLAGQLLLFRFLTRNQPQKKYAMLLLLFAFPSVAFWTSGMHKDGIAIAAIGIILYYADQLFFSLQQINNKAGNGTGAVEKSFFPGSLLQSAGKTGILFSFVMVLAGILLLLVVRNYLLLLMMPCMLGYWFCYFSHRLQALKFIVVFAACYVVFFQLKWLHSDWNILEQMRIKQLEFMKLPQGNTNMKLTVLQPGVINFFKQVPVAIYHCVLLPTVLGISSWLELVPAIDNLALLLLLAFAVLYRQKLNSSNKALVWMGLFFALSVFIFTGAIVPNLGALVRYRMPGTLFIMVALITIAGFSPLQKILSYLPSRFRSAK